MAGLDESRRDVSVLPRRAAVTPRATLAGSGDALPLEGRIVDLLGRGQRGRVCIAGPRGIGKTQALGHLAAVLPASTNVYLMDDPDEARLAAGPADRLVIYTAEQPRADGAVCLSLAAWTDDDVVEYLLARHRERCDSVMRRLRIDSGRAFLGGWPELWHLVLDELAGDEALPDTPSALDRVLGRAATDALILSGVAERCLGRLLQRKDAPAGDDWIGAPGSIWHLAYYRPVQMVLAARHINKALGDGADCAFLKRRLPRELLREGGRAVRSSPQSIERLNALARQYRRRKEMRTIAGLLLAADAAWRPFAGRRLMLSGAYLPRARWEEIALPRVRLARANLMHAGLGDARLGGIEAAKVKLDRAILRRCRLDGGQLRSARFTGAVCSGMSAVHADLRDANFTGALLDKADLTSAELWRARLDRAMLAGATLVKASITRASLDGANLRGADLTEARANRISFRTAELDSACFANASVQNCDFEGVCAIGIDFRSADLGGSDLTDSVFRRSIFTGARLCNAGLAGIDWEGADLRDADFTGASFHLGSTRSGLVGSPIASEGSRTGFYTDEYQEQNFREPEEIRKANLCGADLTGAIVEKADWYLVDLRGATYSAYQAEHFRRCRAIL